MIDYRVVTYHQPEGHRPCAHDWQALDAEKPHRRTCVACGTVSQWERGRLASFYTVSMNPSRTTETSAK